MFTYANYIIHHYHINIKYKNALIYDYSNIFMYLII